MAKRITWMISVLVTLLLLTRLVFVIYDVSGSYDPSLGQLATPQHVTEFLDNHFKAHPPTSDTQPIFIPTGAFIQSMNFINANTVLMSGYLWQKFTKPLLTQITPGFVFPEAINLEVRKAYERKIKDTTTIGWYFEGEFIQSFDYVKYPLDHKTVWLRIWPKAFDKHVILTPDLSAYTTTRPRDMFGVDSEIVLKGFTVLETFFKYRLSNYDTNFGIKNYVGQRNFPELYFNIVIKRNTLNAFMTNLLPLAVVLLLSFLTLLIVTRNEENRGRFGFTLQGILRLCGVFVFIVLLSHLHLRSSISEGTVVYIEYVYFIAYLAIIYVALDAFIIMKENIRVKCLKFLTYEDNLIPKAFFLPFIIMLLLIVTEWTLR